MLLKLNNQDAVIKAERLVSLQFRRHFESIPLEIYKKIKVPKKHFLAEFEQFLALHFDSHKMKR